MASLHPASAIPYSREDHVHPSDTSRLAVGGGQTITGGFQFRAVRTDRQATSLINALLGNYQYRRQQRRLHHHCASERLCG